MHVLRFAGILITLLFIGCSSDGGLKAPEVVPGKGQLGDACTRSEDCKSTVCVEMVDGTGVCSLSCSDSKEVCPNVSNWECVRSSSYPIDVCACLKLGDREECGDGLDNDCNGVADDCRNCDGIAVANDDPNHCGGCDNVCNRGQTCVRGECRCPESLPDDCSGCTNLKSDGLNCGTCGAACGPGQKCVDGACACPEGETFCEGFGCVNTTVSQDHCGYCDQVCTLGRLCKEKACVCDGEGKTFCENAGCIDLDSDGKHCGACDKACSSDMICKSGACVCPEGKTDCGGVCVDLQTNTTNCGACSKACGKVQACVGGTCGCTELGRTICGDECTDTKTDEKHCGSCGKTCATGEVCTAGTCTCPSGLYCNGACIARNDAANCGSCGKTCATAAGQLCSAGVCICQGSGLTACGDKCVYKLTDKANCGTCGNACEPGQSCVNGVCNCTYSAQTYCPDQDACVYLSNDAQNCGNCGTTCKTGQVCSGGQCTCSYSGQSYCNDTDGCVTLSSSNQHCGACGNACRTGETCSYGTCRCPTGQTYCETAKACVSLTTDAANCGACGNTCPSAQTCQSGACRCPTGQSYCESAKACVSLTTDAANCGTCGNACQPTQTCQSGVCRCPYTGYQFCSAANACVDVYYDEQNCGACGKICPTGTLCSYGTCRCSLGTETLCGETCHDLLTDEANCGTCGKTCASNQVCTSGTCQCPVPTVGTPVRLTNNTANDTRPSAAWDGTHVGVAYAQVINSYYSQLRFALLNPDGTLISDVALTTYTGSSQGVTSQPELIWNGEEYALTWIADSTEAQVMFLRLDETGTPKGTPINVGNYTAFGFYPAEPYVAWSDVYKGYAIVASSTYHLAFRRIGADASTLETPNRITNSYFSASDIRMVVAPDGSWGTAGSSGGVVSFATFNSDGSRTLSPATLSTNVYSSAVGPALIHDGKAWFTAWVGSSGRDILVNRGSMSSVLGSLVTSPSTTNIGDVELTLVGTDLAVGWTERVGTSSMYRYRVQRFAVPTTAFTVAPGIHPAVDVLATENIQATGDISLVGTGSGLVAVWADNRWGNREIYAAALDLKSCP